MEKYIQYGFGLKYPLSWQHYDSSVVSLLHQVPVLGTTLSTMEQLFAKQNKNSKQVLYGSMCKGLPITKESCQGAFCWRGLELLNKEQLTNALLNSYTMLKKEGVFRFALPESVPMSTLFLYEDSLSEDYSWLSNTYYNCIKGESVYKIYLWDYQVIYDLLRRVGFSQIRLCEPHTCDDSMFDLVEPNLQHEGWMYVEAIK